MPQTVDRIDFACPDVDISQWPKLSCGGTGQLALQDGGLQLGADQELIFADNGQIRAFDDNHKLVFDRANDRLELHEIGDIRFLTGGPTPTEKLRIRADGMVGIGTNVPGALLHVAGEIRADGPLTVTANATVNGDLAVTGSTNLAGNTAIQGNLQVSGILDATELRQGGSPLAGSRWDTVSSGINFAGGNVGVGTTTPDERIDVAGRIKSNALTIGPWPASQSFVFFGTNSLNQTQAGNYALLQDATGSDAGRTFLNSPKQIHFRINNADRMFLANNGNVGIGTTSPGAPLHVAQYIAVGPFSATGGQGGIDVTGPVAELGFVRRSLTSWPATRQAGDRFVWYNPNGTARLWTERNGDLLTVKSDGSLGIGTTNPVQKLHVAGSYIRVDGRGNEQIYIGGDGAGNDVQLGSFNPNVKNASVWNAGNKTRMNFFVNDLFHTGNVTRISDARLKTNIEPLTNVLEALEQIRTVSFDWNELSGSLGLPERRREIGVLAQEVEAVFPALVSDWGTDGYKGVDYTKLATILISALKELHREFQQLKDAMRMLDATQHG